MYIKVCKTEKRCPVISWVNEMSIIYSFNLKGLESQTKNKSNKSLISFCKTCELECPVHVNCLLPAGCLILLLSSNFTSQIDFHFVLCMFFWEICNINIIVDCKVGKSFVHSAWLSIQLGRNLSIAYMWPNPAKLSIL